ncbi:hypothetical protein BCT47_20935 [Vibrio splendidus]|uniref:Polysaccharide biosynthesis protein n=1 Tax=Vibrio splendidus TaxID=29497 RepID=A0AB35N2C1_VIBSP|nr:hypothetical protein [Vibrio splendidus]MDP2502846.1 hypothetical protein [Vibrio splendidus]PMG54854.1 hypothetical protein BCU89_14270 [Vibrio splendidus]PMM74653.1 hypothetical protein BCT47_20935 [Vibrio splendidus]
MLDKKYSIELFGKAIAKASGLIKQFFVLIFIGVSQGLDTFYVATSLSSIILSLIAWSEIMLIPKMNKNLDNIDRLMSDYSGAMFALSILCTILISIISVITLDIETAKWVVLIGIWSTINVTNSIKMLAFRVQGEMTPIFSYFSMTSIYGMVIFVCISIISSSFGFHGDIYIYILYISLIVPELYFFFKWHKPYQSEQFNFEVYLLKKLLKELVLSSKSRGIVFILILVYSIDATDKLFTTSVDGGASLLVYGSMLPLILRNVFDVKALFFSEIDKIGTIDVRLEKLKSIMLRLIILYCPIVSFLICVIYFIGWDIVVLLDLNFTSFEFDSVLKILIIYSILTPTYIFWDLCYRVYYVYQYQKLVVGIVSIGFIINVALNYLFSIVFDLGVYGISISTLFVFSFYSISSLFFLFYLKRTY